MTLLNIGLCSSTLLPNWDQASGTDWGKHQKRFGAIGRRWGEGGEKGWDLDSWKGGRVV